ncbi:MAG: MYG1 family protein [Roseibium sp.]|uniref:MYG1 family protein n=1 Tax=Roseibium sp. TaxID=1936156 RepID=UPI0032996639
MTKITELVTHNGKFHADEVFSTMILKDLFPEAELVRSRDPEWTAPAEGRIVYDVGGAFDPEQNLFDHHQTGAPTREDGAAYSSFGLIWQEYGAEWLSRRIDDPTLVDTLWGRLDRGFVNVIDALDTGEYSADNAGRLRVATLPMMIEDCNPVFDDDDPASVMDGFTRAMTLAEGFLETRVHVMSASIRAGEIARQAVIDTGDRQIMELSRGMPFERAIRELDADHILFVVTKRDTDWSISTVRDTPGSYVNRKDLPAEWAGLTGEDLSAATGVPGGVFCHKALFVAIAETREAAMAMAEMAVRYEIEERSIAP